MYIKSIHKIFASTSKIRAYKKYLICSRRSHTISQEGPWKVLFFGTDNFAVESLKALHKTCETKVQRLEVVTSRNVKHSPVLKYAKENELNIYEWPLEGNIPDFHIGVVVSFGHLIPSNIINTFPVGMINVHGSLLPKWRGAAPISYALMNGESKTGVTVMKIMPKQFDIGPIIAQKEIEIGEHETLPELSSKLSKLGANLLVETFENLPELLQSAKPQDKAKATYAPKIRSEMCIIKWNKMSAKRIYDLHRALFGLYPLTTFLEDTKVKFLDIELIDPTLSSDLISKLEGEAPGTVIFDRERDILIVKCIDDSFIAVKKMSVENTRCKSATDFRNGFLAAKRKKKERFN